MLPIPDYPAFLADPETGRIHSAATGDALPVWTNGVPVWNATSKVPRNPARLLAAAVLGRPLTRKERVVPAGFSSRPASELYILRSGQQPQPLV